MSAFFKSIRRWHNEAVSRRQLARLDRGVLADLGVGRNDIGTVVRHLR